MKPEDAEEYTQSLGQIVAGSWRQIALAKRLGVPQALGLSVEQWVRDRLGGHVKRSVQERLEIIKELTKEGYSNVAIGEVLGVDEGTVRNDRRSENSEPSKGNGNAEGNEINDEESAATEATSENSDPIDAVAALAAGDKVRRQAEAAENREERLANIAELSKANERLDTSQRYPIIYADPPWRYENPPIGDTGRSIENHYPTMALEEICALPVAELAAADALLYLWATAPKLAECMEVIRAWGFDYRTCLVWDKEKIGMGYYARNQHELLLIAKRGDIPTPVPGTQPNSVYREARGKHSAKPIFYYEMIEAAYPQLAKIELFSRCPRQGWVGWGNQANA
jgi:N6-adenosine-specific RNA methylase IME4